MKFRKKPVIIEAFQMTKELSKDQTKWPDWLRNAFDNWTMFTNTQGEYMIRTLEGNHLVSWNDWIIQGVQGELYPCKPDIFEQTYERITK